MLGEFGLRTSKNERRKSALYGETQLVRVVEELEVRHLLSLAAPVLLGPSNGATGQSTTPIFNWQNVIGANQYRLLIATSPGALPTGTANPGSGVLYNISLGNVTSYKLPFTLQPGTYYWEVRAGNPTQGSAWSPYRSFTTVLPDSTPPTFSNVKLNGLAPYTSSQVTLGQTLNFSGLVTDNKSLMALTVNITGPKGSNLTVTSMSVGGTSQSLSSLSVNTANSFYAGTPGTYWITVFAKDTSNNVSSLTWNVNVVSPDKTPPVFVNALLGNQAASGNFSAKLGDVFSFSGSAYDIGGLTKITIKLSGPKGNDLTVGSYAVGGTSQSLSGYSINTANAAYAGVPGTYWVTAFAEDISGNVGSTPTWSFTIAPLSTQGTRNGVDYAAGSPNLSALKAAGYDFVVRYLSTPANAWKIITKGEAQAFQNAGIDIVLVFESTANRMLAGYSAGVDDAKAAIAAAKNVGAPSDFFCYFACDFDATAKDQAAINSYLDGAASVMGLSRVGFYGGYTPLKAVLDAGKAAKGWQTYAWSYGNQDNRASIYQYKNGVTVAGAQLDLDYAYGANFGQWSASQPVVNTVVPAVPVASFTNGGFENGNLSDWTVMQGGQFPMIVSGGAASGTYAVQLGDGAGGLGGSNTASIQQVVNISSTAAAPTLSLNYKVVGTDGPTWDWLRVYVNGTQVASWSTDTGGWKTFSYDLSGFKGQNVTVKISSWTADAVGPVSYYIDNVNLSTYAPAAAVSLPANGGFENGNLGGWIATQGGQFPKVVSSGAASGSYALQLGDGGSGLGGGNTASVQQTVTIPTSSASPLLSLKYKVVGTDGPQWDWLKVFINGMQIASWSNDTGGWKTFTYDLSAFKGQSVTVKLSSWTADAVAPVNYYLDDINIVA